MHRPVKLYIRVVLNNQVYGSVTAPKETATFLNTKAISLYIRLFIEVVPKRLRTQHATSLIYESLLQQNL